MDNSISRISPLFAGLLLASGAGLFLGCKPQTAQQPETVDPTPNLEQPNESLSIRGTWISEAYAKSLERHGSPRRAQEGSEDVMLILPDSLSGRASLHYNFHELLPDLAIRKAADGYRLIDPMAMRSAGSDYILKNAGDDRITLNGKPFVRVDIALSENRPLVLEKLLFDGLYIMPNGQRVTFDPYGRVRGLDRYTFYMPQQDYFDEGLQVDQVGLGTSSEDLTWFGFSLKKGKLTIYELRCKTRDKATNRCVDVAFGDVRYTMERTTGIE